MMFLENLSDKVWATKNARFTASKRMQRNKKGSMAATYFLSASIIVINLFVFLPNIRDNNEYSIIITLLTIILSIFCMVITSLISHLDYSNRDRLFQNCGRELDELNSQILIRIENGADKMTNEEKDALCATYKEILYKYDENHTNFDWLYADYLNARKQRKWKLKECLYLENIRYYLKSIKYFFRWNIWDVHMIYWLIAIIPIIGIVYFFILLLCK